MQFSFVANLTERLASFLLSRLLCGASEVCCRCRLLCGAAVVSGIGCLLLDGHVPTAEGDPAHLFTHSAIHASIYCHKNVVSAKQMAPLRKVPLHWLRDLVRDQ